MDDDDSVDSCLEYLVDLEDFFDVVLGFIVCRASNLRMIWIGWTCVYLRVKSGWASRARVYRFKER